MKIGILTQRLETNYGGLLQNYALQQILIRAGHEAETIDWDLSDLITWKWWRLKRALQSMAIPQRYIASKKEMAAIRRNTDCFIRKYIRRTAPVTSLNGFAKMAEKGGYEGYVVGSDQCWRPCYNEFLPAMFLSFTEGKNVKRIAYAASFGTDVWEFSSDETSKCSALAKKFDVVTVREDIGVKLCKEHLGVNAVQVLDPTMLLHKEDYMRLVEDEKEPRSNGTLFYYILDPDPRKTEFVSHVAEKMNMEPFQVLPKHQKETRNRGDVKDEIEDCVYPNVTSWIRAFMDSELTIVDSFHGVVFSIIFNKPFWVIGNAERGMARFSSLLKLFKLEDRMVDVNKLDAIDYSRSIDWDAVNVILEQKRVESNCLLLNGCLKNECK